MIWVSGGGTREQLSMLLRQVRVCEGCDVCEWGV